MALARPPVCDIGWEHPAFTLPDPSGRVYASSDLYGPGGLLVAFICNHCPYVVGIADDLAAKLNALQKSCTGVVAIMSNDFDAYPADAPERMIPFATRHGFDFPYLVDADQTVAKAFDAACTPDFFGFNADGQLQYRGNFAGLTEAMTLIRDTGTGPAEQIPSMGCSIKWR